MTAHSIPENRGRWQAVAASFSRHAGRYDQWFDASPVYGVELRALREILPLCPHPRGEIGIGPGRFAVDLAISFGVDPAAAALALARDRNLAVAMARGEELPLRDGAAGSLFLLFTLCFLDRPRQVLAAARQALMPRGRLVVAMIPAESSWGRRLAARGRAGDPLYCHAVFYRPHRVVEMLAQEGFSLIDCRSTLFGTPGRVDPDQLPRAGVQSEAGCVVLVAAKR